MKPEPIPNSPGRDPLKGFLFALAATALVSTNFVTAKYGLAPDGFNPETFSSVWTAAGAVFSLVILLLTGRKHEFGLPRAEPVKTLLLGFFTGAGMLLTWAGIRLLDPSFAAFLWRFMPVLILLFGVVFLRERLRLLELAPLALMVLGGAWSTVGRWDIVGTGVILTLIAACAGAAQMLLAKMLVERHRPNAVVFHRLAFGALCIVAWTALLGRFDFDVPLRYWLVTLLGALLGPCLSHVLLFRAYRYWELSRAGIVLAAQPLFVLPMAFAFLGDFPSGRELTGGALIMAGAFWLACMHLRRRKPAVTATLQ